MARGSKNGNCPVYTHNLEQELCTDVNLRSATSVNNIAVMHFIYTIDGGALLLHAQSSSRFSERAVGGFDVGIQTRFAAGPALVLGQVRVFFNFLQ